jgi:hypothetical protein
MTSQTRLLASIAMLAALGLSACGSSAPSLMTGSLFGSGDTKKAAEPKPETAQDRLLQVATTSAYAQRCGYVFDPQSVLTQYFASEQALGTPPDQLAKIQQGYDQAFTRMSKSAAGDEGFCSEERTAGIKRDLGRVIAGDFSGPKRHVDIGLFGSGNAAPMNREAIFNPQHK